MSAEKDNEALLVQAAAGSQQAIDELIGRHRSRLKRMVRFRLDPRLAGRLDESDVVQDAYLEAVRTLSDYLEHRPLPFYLWLRRLTTQQLIAAHRRHLGTEKRNAAREISLHRGATPAATSASLAAQMLGRLTSPTKAAVKAELRLQLQEALNSMDDIDREVLAMRHFEQLTNSETATALSIAPSAASNRYARALERLGRIINPSPEK